MSDYLFRLKSEDARKALAALFNDEKLPPDRVLSTLKELREELEEYVAALEDEMERRQTGTWQRDAAGSG